MNPWTRTPASAPRWEEVLALTKWTDPQIPQVGVRLNRYFPHMEYGRYGTVPLHTISFLYGT